MFVIVGIIIVVVAILSGFLFEGGNIFLLMQWSEIMIICGAAIGSIIISAPPTLLKKIIAEVTKSISPGHFTKKDYLELLKSFNELFLIAQRDGLLAIEKHIENPKESDILSANKKFADNEMLRNFFSDTMKVMLSGGVPPHELEDLIETEIETFELESKPVPSSISRVGDSLPGLGIVAAVLGIIVTMASVDKGAIVVGEHVAAALVGTFLGVLLSYGFVNPLAANIEQNIENKTRVLQTIKACIVAYAKGNPPVIAVEIARRTIFSDERPTFSELENFVRGKS